jgi:CRP-like cAMP-binding protein
MDTFSLFLNSIATIPQAELEEGLSFFSFIKLRKGEFFVEQGKVCQQIAYIEKGAMRVYYLNHKAEEITSCFCTENSLTTSYKSFILREPSVLNIQAIEETQLIVIGFDDLQKLYARSSAWQTIGRSITEQEYLAMEKYASVLNCESAKEKYLRLLKEQPGVILKAKVEHIASYLGVTRRTLSRIRKEVASDI